VKAWYLRILEKSRFNFKTSIKMMLCVDLLVMMIMMMMEEHGDFREKKSINSSHTQSYGWFVTTHDYHGYLNRIHRRVSCISRRDRLRVRNAKTRPRRWPRYLQPPLIQCGTPRQNDDDTRRHVAS